ncbi:dis3 like 3'-5' exoribonuclease 2 isoform X1 [Leptinotarsa decemlineata]|uniref:dis3 like 3'-5' exoribonuclease 2 isoform X1 n=1 Tax=Leptinotarsa decemlineata TaxID=7539 RepID=UPI003D3091F3
MMTSGSGNMADNFVDYFEVLQLGVNNAAGHSTPTNQVLFSAGPSRIVTNSSNVENRKKEEKSKRTRRKPKRKKIKDEIDNALGTNSSNGSHSPSVNSKVTFNSSLSHSRNRKSDTRSEQKLEKFTLIIKPVTDHSDGKLIKRKNCEKKYINLKSFVSIGSKNCVFTTDQSTICHLSNNLIEPRLNVLDKKSKSKIESRKFPLQETKKTKKRRDKSDKEYDETPFPNYLSHEEVNVGLASGTLIKGFVRINPRKSCDCYVNNEDTTKPDYYLTSVMDRNRALDGDEVILQIKPEADWIDGNKTAKVVYILQKIHPRTVIGSLKPRNSGNCEYALFYPRDSKCPLLRIPEVNWPNNFKNDPKAFEEILLLAKITKWVVPAYAYGFLTEIIGFSGNLKSESLSILREFCLDTTPFGEEVREYLPQWKNIPRSELKRREDIRKECVFTIDPATARDLDDAVSVKTLKNGNYEIGVHISDVSYYLEEGTELDQLVSKKATSIYMVETVYHMLPLELCLHCSLLPGEDRLSFSVFWEMTKEGDIINKRYTRSIMNSCTKLAYEHAQLIIENPDKSFKVEDFPEIHNGFEPKDLVNTVNILHSIAVRLRNNRIQNGALKIDQVKLSFNLDPSSGQPKEYFRYENKESHRLIEEFMLLANISVAEKIYESFPDKAFLRCHEPPKQTMLQELKNNLATYGIHLDISSSGNIASSLKKYITSDYTGICRQAVLNHLTAKSMTRAKYFASSAVESVTDFNHYALSVPIYTHFTSPIRRYADVMVHRLLAASLNYCKSPEWDEHYVSAIAANCNLQKYNAKRAGEASIELYLSTFIENHKPYEQDCVVVDVKERAFDVIVLKTGSIIRIYQNNCEQGTQWKIENVLKARSSSKDNGQSSSSTGKKQLRLTVIFPKTKYFPQSKMIVEIFSLVKVNLQKKERSYKLEGTLLRPVPAQTFTKKYNNTTKKA